MKDIELCTQDNYVNCVKKANDRTLWRAMVADLRQPKTARWMNELIVQNNIVFLDFALPPEESHITHGG